MTNQVDEFEAYRSKMNDKLIADNNKVIKRILNLDTNSFAEGTLGSDTKELLGLVASLVLKCDDCVKYHIESSHQLGWKKEQIVEALSIGTLIGGTIIIPHLRKAYDYLEQVEEKYGKN